MASKQPQKLIRKSADYIFALRDDPFREMAITATLAADPDKFDLPRF